MTAQLPFVTIIILNWNGRRHLDVVMPSLITQDYPAERYEILFADNGSTDDSVAYIAANFPTVRIAQFDQNYGFAEGNNKAAVEARGDLLALLNNDTEADPQWLSALVAAHQQHPDALLGSQAFQFEARGYTANSLTKLTGWGVPVNVEVFSPRAEASQTVRPTFYADAAGMLITKQLFTELGGFDTTYFAYEEEKDLSWRAWLLGHPSYLVPGSVYYHKGGSTLGQHSTRATYLLWRNGLRNMIKYLSTPRLMSALILHVGYSLASFVVFFLPRRQWVLAWSMCRAYWSVLIGFPTLWRERRQWQHRRVIGDGRFTELGLTLSWVASWRYVQEFLRRRQAFTARPTEHN